jgi:hypothetical protein
MATANKTRHGISGHDHRKGGTWIKNKINLRQGCKTT